MSVNPSETSSNDYNKEILQKVIREGKINKSSLLPEVVDYIKKTLNEHPEWEHQSLHVEHIVKILKEEQDVSSQKIATLAHHHLEKAILSSTNPVDFIETESTHPLTIEALGMLLTHAKIGTLPEMVIYSLFKHKGDQIIELIKEPVGHDLIIQALSLKTPKKAVYSGQPSIFAILASENDAFARELLRVLEKYDPLQSPKQKKENPRSFVNFFISMLDHGFRGVGPPPSWPKTKDKFYKPLITNFYDRVDFITFSKEKEQYKSNSSQLWLIAQMST